MELSRSYTGKNDTVSEVVDTHTWTSAEVKSAFEAQASPADGWVLLDAHTFTNLPIYAVNGEQYTYTVTEKKDDFLEGFDTWAVAKGLPDAEARNAAMIDGNKGIVVNNLYATKAEEDTPDDVDATFINSYDSDADGIVLKGTKVWDDWDNNQLRPTISNGSVTGITLTVKRHADSQPGQRFTRLGIERSLLMPARRRMEKFPSLEPHRLPIV